MNNTNSKPKHTPGPWSVETYHGSLFKICKPDFKVGDEIAHRLEADRRLIAAAPELLAWTVELLAQLKRDHPDGMDGIKQHVEALIKRATGGQS